MWRRYLNFTTSNNRLYQCQRIICYILIIDCWNDDCIQFNSLFCLDWRIGWWIRDAKNVFYVFIPVTFYVFNVFFYIFLKRYINSVLNINKFQRKHLKAKAINISVCVLFTLTEIILFKKWTDLSDGDWSDLMLCFQYFFGRAYYC